MRGGVDGVDCKSWMGVADGVAVEWGRGRVDIGVLKKPSNAGTSFQDQRIESRSNMKVHYSTIFPFPTHTVERMCACLI